MVSGQLYKSVRDSRGMIYTQDARLMLSIVDRLHFFFGVAGLTLPVAGIAFVQWKVLEPCFAIVAQRSIGCTFGSSEL